MIRRARFLRCVLGAAAAALVAFACGRPVPSETPLGGTPTFPDPPGKRRNVSYGAASASAAAEKQKKQKKGADAGKDDDDDEMPSGADAPEAEDENGDDETNGGDSVNPPAEAASNCDDSKGEPAACDAIEGPPGQLCTGAIVTRRACEGFRDRLKPAVAESWTRCLKDRSGTAALCEPRALENCTLEAIDRACVEPATTDPCRKLARSCESMIPVLTFDVCRKALSSLQPAHRDVLAGCLEAACDSGDFGACLP